MFIVNLYMNHMYIVNFKRFYINSENERKQDAFLSFNALLFPERKITGQMTPKICTIYVDGAIAESTVFK